jgi:cation transport regulator ChaB
MPYDPDDRLPPAVRKLPRKQREAWRKAFNDAWRRYAGRRDRESLAHAVAWGVVNGMREDEHDSTPRELRMSLGERKFEETEDGGLLVRDVRLLATGVWTDSLSRTAVEYTAEALQGATWQDTGLWARHGGGMPRNITDKVGEVRNPHFNGEDAIVGDLYFHNKTQLSRDIAEMTKAGLYNYVSSEVMTADAWDASQGRYVTNEVVFTGVATVNRGACTTCTIKDNEAGTMAEEQETKRELGDEFASKLKELEDGFKKEIEDLRAELSRSDNEDGRIKELEGKLTDAEKRIKELEDAPTPPKTSNEQAKELAEPLHVVTITRNGEIMGVN